MSYSHTMNKTQSERIKITLKSAQPIYPIKYQMVGDVNHLTIPCTLIKEGVFTGVFQNTLYYTADALSSSIDKFDGLPVSIEHPPLDDSVHSGEITHPEFISKLVGFVKDPIFNKETKAVDATLFLNMAKLPTVSPMALGTILNEQPMDVSTGGTNLVEFTVGEFDGKEYMGIVHETKPDHLALLPNEEGACSWEKGCGIGVHLQSGDGKHVPMQLRRGDVTEVLEYNISYVKVVDLIRDVLWSMENKDVWYSLKEVTETYVIYSKHPTGAGKEYYKTEYNYSETKGTVEFTGNPVQVYKQVVYSEESTEQLGKNKGGSPDMADCTCSEEKINELIELNVGFTEDNKEELKNLSEDSIDGFISKAKEFNKKAEVTPVKELNETGDKDKIKAHLQGLKEEGFNFMDLMDDSVKNEIGRALRFHESQHSQMVEQLAKSQDVFSKEELEKKDVDELVKIHNLNAGTKAKELPIQLGRSNFIQTTDQLGNEDTEEEPLLGPSFVDFLKKNEGGKD